MKQPCVLSIAGFDPCGSAGVLADMRIFEAYGARGIAAISAITYQSDYKFNGLQWLSCGEIENQLLPLYDEFDIGALKVGLISDLTVLATLLRDFKRRYPAASIVWDPIVSASAGFTFHYNFSRQEVDEVLGLVTVVTPNRLEIQYLMPGSDPEQVARDLSRFCSVMLKGGHAEGTHSEDLLYVNGEREQFSVERIAGVSKHGTGCVYSAALATALACGEPLRASCAQAQRSVVSYLQTDQVRGFSADVSM